jgi:transcriptional regulator with XRE-family HTH domain
MTALKKRRLALGLSQMDLAEKVGVSLLTIQLWERGVSQQMFNELIGR